jgi:hypothetical protein
MFNVRCSFVILLWRFAHPSLTGAPATWNTAKSRNQLP